MAKSLQRGLYKKNIVAGDRNAAYGQDEPVVLPDGSTRTGCWLELLEDIYTLSAGRSDPMLRPHWSIRICTLVGWCNPPCDFSMWNLTF